MERESAPLHDEGRALAHVEHRGRELPSASAPPDPAMSEVGADPSEAGQHAPAPSYTALVLPRAGAVGHEVYVGGGTSHDAAGPGRGPPDRGTSGQGAPLSAALSALPLLQPLSLKICIL